MQYDCQLLFCRWEQERKDAACRSVAATDGMYLFRREFQRWVWTAVGSLLADLCPVNDTVDFPLSLLLFFIIGININLPENGYEIGKASWPP